MALPMINELLFVNGVVLEDYLDWLKNILKLTGLSIGSILLLLFIFWIILNLLISFLAQIFPFFKGVILMLELILFPGSIMHNVMHIFIAKKLGIPTELVVAFGYGWSRVGIKTTKNFASLREGIFFFWAPFLNVLVIIIWIIPGMILFEWLDTLIDNTIFYWLWFYILFSLVLYGLPDLADILNPFQITIIKSPEFYIFIMFYVLIAPITLIFWGWGLTLILTFIYIITTIYEIQKISKKEEVRLKRKCDRVYYTTEQPIVIVTDEYS